MCLPEDNKSFADLGFPVLVVGKLYFLINLTLHLNYL